MGIPILTATIATHNYYLNNNSIV